MTKSTSNLMQVVLLSANSNAYPLAGYPTPLRKAC